MKGLEEASSADFLSDQLLLFKFDKNDLIMLMTYTCGASHFAGFLFDMTGNYDIPFLVVAAALGVAAMSVLAIFITNRPRTRR